MGYYPHAYVGFGVVVEGDVFNQFCDEIGECNIEGLTLGFLGDSRGDEIAGVLCLADTLQEGGDNPSKFKCTIDNPLNEFMSCLSDEQKKLLKAKPRWLIWAAII